jgi:3-phosphoshikimate 1-carboxyvinyltransferase
MTDDKKNDGRPRGDRPERPRRPRSEAPGRSPAGEGGRPRVERPYDSERPRGDRPRRPQEGGGERPERSYDSERPRGDRPRRPMAGEGERSERSYDSERPRDDRPRRPSPADPGHFSDGEGDRPYADRSFDPERPRGAAGALIELDLELMKLLVRRAKLVSRVRGGKTHAATPQAVQSEKAVRRAFEKNASTFSKDPRFTRKLFDLLQDVRVLSHEESEKEPGFHLSPPRKPVKLEMPAPTRTETVLLWAALAAYTGKKTTLERVALAKDLVQGLRALADCGAPVRREEQSPAVGSVEVASGNAPTFAGKTVHVGDSFLALCLTAFAALGEPGICRLTGGSELKDQDLSFLQHTLPSLGARLAHVMTHARTLPASVECSGVLPECFSVLPETPVEALRALLLAPLIWNRPFVLDLADIPADLGAEALHSLEPIFAVNPERVHREDHILRYTPGDIVVPERPDLPSDPAVRAYFAALPLLAGGGEVLLTGPHPVDDPESAEAAALLRGFGLTAENREGGVVFRFVAAPAAVPAPPNSSNLLPLWVCLAIRAQGDAPGVPNDGSAACVALEEFREHLHLDKSAGPAVPWVCPDGFWGMAYALAAFIRSGLRLVNPNLVADTAPAFWSVFNRLPTPPNPALPPAKEKENDAPPVRRRVVAD